MNAHHKMTVLWVFTVLLVACGDESAADNPAEENLAVNAEEGAEQSDEQEETQSCPSMVNFGQAYKNPCQLELSIAYNAVTEQSYNRDGGERQLSSTSSLDITGSLNQLYPPPLFAPSGKSLYFGEEPHLPFLVFDGEVQSYREGYVTPILVRRNPRPAGSHPTSSVWEAAYSGPVSMLNIQRFEPRLDEDGEQCLSIGMELLVNGEGIIRHTLEDGSVQTDESGPPAYFRQVPDREGWWAWSRTESGIGPHEVIVCEGEPPTGASEDCEKNPLSYYGDEVCASEHLEPCSSGNCQVDLGRGGWMIWYGMQAANDERSHWTFSGTVSTSDSGILKINDAETTWSLNLDLFIVPKNLEYE